MRASTLCFCDSSKWPPDAISFAEEALVVAVLSILRHEHPDVEM